MKKTEQIITGIDAGTSHIRVVVSQSATDTGRGAPVIIGTGSALARGFRQGYVSNIEEAAQSIRAAIQNAEKASGVKIKRAYVALGGVGLSAVTSLGSAIVTKADGEVTDLDIKRATETAEALIPTETTLNRKIIHSIPVEYRLDGKPVLGRPIGQRGSKLEARVFFVLCLSQHLEDLVEAVEMAGVADVEDVMVSPFASSLVTLTKAQKIAGCVLTNIGSETTTAVVFENNIPISLEVFPMGGNDITNDIALGLKLSLEDAESIKLGVLTGIDYPRRRYDDILETRLQYIFQNIDGHLRKIGKNGLLPAGIILTGGTAHTPLIEEIAKSVLKLPSRVSRLAFGGGKGSEIRDASWAVAFGLCIIGMSQTTDNSFGNSVLKKTQSTVVSWLKQLLP